MVSVIAVLCPSLSLFLSLSLSLSLEAFWSIWVLKKRIYIFYKQVLSSLHPGSFLLVKEYSKISIYKKKKPLETEIKKGHLKTISAPTIVGAQCMIKKNTDKSSPDVYGMGVLVV